MVRCGDCTAIVIAGYRVRTTPARQSVTRARLELATENGDTVVAEYPGVPSAWVDVFSDETHRVIAHARRSLRAAEIEFQAALEAGGNAAQLNKKLVMIQRARVSRLSLTPGRPLLLHR